MENRSRLPGEPSLDHPGVPTGRLGHRASLKTVKGLWSGDATVTCLIRQLTIVCVTCDHVCVGCCLRLRPHSPLCRPHPSVGEPRIADVLSLD